MADVELLVLLPPAIAVPEECGEGAIKTVESESKLVGSTVRT